VESSEQIAARFDERAARYDDSAMHRGLAAAVAEFASLERVSDVLDVATGTALLLRSLPADPQRTLTGIDISLGMLAVAREKLPAARFLHADAAQLPFDDASFDLVTCVTALHIMPAPRAALSEWCRVLRGDGRILIATFALDDPVTGVRSGPKIGHGPSRREEHAPFGTRAALQSFAATAALRVTRTLTWAYPATGDPEDVCLITEFARA
jgi:ubiquinone/menaquinone biosynthesis C-methylase UbiE